MSVAIDKISFENYRQYGTGQIHFKTDGQKWNRKNHTVERHNVVSLWSGTSLG